MPFLEVYNREQLLEAGYKYKEEIIKIKQELMKTTHVGTYQGDRIIEDAENDPDIDLEDEDEEEDDIG